MQNDDVARTMIPGAREPRPLTTFGPPAVPQVMPEGPSTMSTETTADRQLEGGGAPSQRGGPAATRATR